jgi:thioredoxin reductase
MPQALRLRATRRHLGPAPGWFMRERVEGRIPSLLEQEVREASIDGKRVVLSLRHADGTRQKVACDHVVAATGYRPNLRKLPFLTAELRKAVAAVENTPILSDVFESSVDGLYAIGPLAANSFGPLMRFMVGAEFAAPRVANHLHRKLGAVRRRQAA